MINATVYAALVRAAKERRTVSYADLCKVADLSADSADDVKILGLILAAIADHEAEAGRPLLPAVVVSDGPNVPASGLFRYAQRHGLQGAADPAYLATELSRVYAHWAPAKPSA
jgi:hypothetical protein